MTYTASLGEPAYRGRQLYHWLHVRRCNEFDAMTDLAAAFRAKLSQDIRISPVKVLERFTGNDNSLKLLFGLPDENRIEGVLIPDGERLTVCLSSQVGCVIGCKFCATGKIGFIRNLTAAEIVGQFIALDTTLDRRISNVVMMGMGEPLLNRTAVFKAAGIITDPDGLGISRRRFSISTVGWVPGIRVMTAAKMRLKLTVSLNATTDEQRRKLMPLAARFPLKEVLSAAAEYSRVSRQRLTFTYLLLNGINDTIEDARRLVGLVRNISCKVNLMEYNEIGGDLQISGSVTTETFQNELRVAGITALLRTSRGEDITAACGQLAGGYPMCEPLI